ncbi:hypothetical protein SAMN05444920_114254 [Nonomuraea solani]|uniref:Asl1-like glycosyl hydrolase catalytic domain-containing protein n=1 Tax=Nonomuraea solani TaxID=1144553 RepID=A0A1H6EQ31_9ACTN|nr:hypothetical protein [Nonomuraea solani]SEG99978.1 hypothetical protein SAMN05444920_114254 [Nonomuraea solani]
MPLRLPIIALATALTLSAGSGETMKPVKPLAYGALGANFNQNLDALDYRELRESGARWVRGFFPMPATDQGDPAAHFAIKTITEAAGRGHDTILSLKFPYDRASFPQPGSPEMAAELARLDRVLPAVLGKVDILTIGNEPFIESLPAERDTRLNVFYETVARHVIDVRRARCGGDCATTLYMGALNRLDLADRRTPAAERWMTFVRETPELAGVDIHPHVPEPENTQAFLDYILPRMRPDQTYLVTEFSLVWHWKKHLRDPIAPAFAQRYGFAAGTQVWQVIKAAIDAPFPQRQWNDFLTSSPWFMDQAGFLRDQMRLYRGTGRLAVATYAFKQDDLMTTDFGPAKDPWLLNSVYVPYTVRPRGNGLSAPSLWLKDFKALQKS